MRGNVNIAPCSPQLKTCPSIAITVENPTELCVVCPRGQENLCPCSIPKDNRIFVSKPSRQMQTSKMIQTTIPSQVSDETDSSSSSSTVLDFGLIVGITVTVTTFLFLIIVLVTLIIFLVRNNRKAKQLKIQKETLELDLKLKTTMALSALMNQSNNSTLVTPTTTPLRSINLTADLQARLENNTSTSTPNHFNTIPPPLDESNINDQVYYDFDSQQARSFIINNTNNEQANESIITDGNVAPVNFASPDINGEKVHYNPDDIGLTNSRLEALPSYNSIFRQLSGDL